MRNDLNVCVFYGPKSKFDLQIPSDIGYFTLSDLVYDLDSKKYTGSILGEIQNLIIYSDEYGTVNEGHLQNIINLLDMYKVQNLYIQNPPRKILKNIERFIKKDNLSVKYYSYDILSTEKITEFKLQSFENIIGQTNALTDILTSLISAQKFNENDKPLVLMFYGPSGVGKTETSKILSKCFNSKADLFIKPFGMYQNPSNINHLYGDKLSDDSFAKELLDRESNIVLIDEFDKANDVCYSAFYQLFDEGIFIDRNYLVNLKNSIIICTSNYLELDEIRKAVGDPIFYRFDAFIKFDKLDLETKHKIFESKFNECLSKLDINEQKTIQEKNLYEAMMKNIDIMNNVREMTTNIKYFMSRILLESSTQSK